MPPLWSAVLLLCVGGGNAVDMNTIYGTGIIHVDAFEVCRGTMKHNLTEVLGMRYYKHETGSMMLYGKLNVRQDAGPVMMIFKLFKLNPENKVYEKLFATPPILQCTDRNLEKYYKEMMGMDSKCFAKKGMREMTANITEMIVDTGGTKQSKSFYGAFKGMARWYTSKGNFICIIWWYRFEKLPQ